MKTGRKERQPGGRGRRQGSHPCHFTAPLSLLTSALSHACLAEGRRVRSPAQVCPTPASVDNRIVLSDSWPRAGTNGRAERQGSGTRREQGISQSWSTEVLAARARNCFGNKGGETSFWFQTQNGKECLLAPRAPPRKLQKTPNGPAPSL